MKINQPHQDQLQSRDTTYKCISEFVETSELNRVKMHDASFLNGRTGREVSVRHKPND